MSIEHHLSSSIGEELLAFSLSIITGDSGGREWMSMAVLSTVPLRTTDESVLSTSEVKRTVMFCMSLGERTEGVL